MVLPPKTVNSTRTVSYDQTEEYFTVENLYDLGISMYLNRRDRER
jgi:hypothetical protein